MPGVLGYQEGQAMTPLEWDAGCGCANAPVWVEWRTDCHRLMLAGVCVACAGPDEQSGPYWYWQAGDGSGGLSASAEAAKRAAELAALGRTL